jgi:hypothetical protein
MIVEILLSLIILLLLIILLILLRVIDLSKSRKEVDVQSMIYNSRKEVEAQSIYNWLQNLENKGALKKKWNDFSKSGTHMRTHSSPRLVEQEPPQKKQKLCIY